MTGVAQTLGASSYRFKHFPLLEDDRFFDFSDAQKVTIGRYKELIRKYFAATRNSSKDPEIRISKVNTKPSEIRVFPENHRKPWNNELLAKLAEEYSHLIIIHPYDTAVELLAKQFDRSTESIRMKLGDLVLRE